MNFIKYKSRKVLIFDNIQILSVWSHRNSLPFLYLPFSVFFILTNLQPYFICNTYSRQGDTDYCKSKFERQCIHATPASRVKSTAHHTKQEEGTEEFHEQRLVRGQKWIWYGRAETKCLINAVKKNIMWSYNLTTQIKFQFPICNLFKHTYCTTLASGSH